MSSVLLFAVLVLHSMMAATFQTSRCQRLREKCSTNPECESIWSSIEKFCSIPVVKSCPTLREELREELYTQKESSNGCAVEKSGNCNMFINFLVTEFPQFKHCNCTKDGCDIQMLLGKTCSSNQGQLQASSIPDVQIIFLQPTKSKEVAQPSLFEKDCMMAKDTCQKDKACSLLYECFQKTCRAEESTCNCQMEGHQCLKALAEQKKTTPGGCKCPEPRCEKCIGIWKNIFHNSYLQQLPEYQTSSLHNNTDANERLQNFDTDHRNTETEWKSSSLFNAEYKPQHSCLHVQVECVSDTVCNRHFSIYLHKCQASEMPSSMNRCKRARRIFYQNMPLNVAQKLTFCDCEELDEKCLHSKELLHGKPYTDLGQVPSCLSIIQTCQGENLCRKKYKVFMSKCLNGVSQSCLENNVCMEYLDTKDLKCSDSAECRKAYIDMWGILRPVECTCDIRSPAEPSLCKLFHHILQSNSCFSQIAGRKAEHYPLLTDLPETKLSPIVGDTIYIAMYSCCAILILGLILLALLKTGTFAKQAKTPSPAPLSERLMIPQQPWIVNCVANDLPGSSHSQPLTCLHERSLWKSD